MGYQIDDGPIEIWTPPDPFPAELVAAIEAGAVFEAHNAQFERAVWIHRLKDQTEARMYGNEYSLGPKPIPMPRYWKDTMAVCAYRSLPLGLDHVAKVLGLAEQKDKEGGKVLRLLSRPRKPTKNDPSTRLSWEAAQAEGLWDKLYTYCKQDIATEGELSKRVGNLPPEEAKLWGLDQVINQRGIHVDMQGVLGAKKAAKQMTDDLQAELVALTGDSNITGKKVDRLKEWMRAHGADLPDMKKETVEIWLERLKDADLPEVVRALEIRQQTSLSSVKKLDALMCAVNDDLRLRGSMQYHAAGTGRWGGRLFQPHNIPRPSATNALDDRGKPCLDIDLLIDHLRPGDYELLSMVYPDVGAALTSSLRGMLVSAPGKRLYVSDFSAVEARVVLWLAGQQDKIDAFKAYDRGEGPDIYCVAAQDLYGRPINKKEDPEERGLGKIQILGCGYQMSAPKLQLQAGQQGVVLNDDQAKWIVDNYRTRNPKVPQLWYGLNDAALSAVGRGQVADFRGIEYRTIKDNAGPWLVCTLPSGRRLWYFNPKIETTEGWNGEPRHNVMYQGRSNKNAGIYGHVRTYGGMLTENVVQAISRCLLAAALFRCEGAGYPVILHVHDEVVAETPDDYGSLKEFNGLVSGPLPAWADGLPMASEGWTGHRYKKG